MKNKPKQKPKASQNPKEKPNPTEPKASSPFFAASLWVSLALIAITLLVYAQTRHYGFVSLDDGLYVTENSYISGGLSPQSVWWALTTDRAGYWVPLTWLSHILDVHLYGLAAGPHHMTNVLLHLINALLLFGVLRRLTRARAGGVWESAFVAGLFAVHPLHVESVAWIAERKDVLSTLFWMLALWAYAGYASRPDWLRYALVVLTFALGLMAKPMIVTLPFVLLLLDIWPLRRVRIESGQRHVWLRLAGEKLPLLALAIASSVLTVVFHSQRGAVGGSDAFPVTLRAANAVVSYASYIRDMLWPAHLAAFYPYESLGGLQVMGSAVVLIGISSLVIWKARMHPYLLVGWLWYLGTLVPVVGLVQAGTQSRADRFTYIPLVGLFVMAAWGFPHLVARWRYRALALPIAATVLLGASTFAAQRQVQYWENRFTLWERALEVTNDNYVAHNVLGMALMEAGRVDEAIGHYHEALRVRADYAEGFNNLGIAYARQGRIEEAITQFRKAIGIPNPDAEMYYNLGFALAQQGQINEAIIQYSEALRIEPGYVAAHTKIADALFLQGKVNEAVARYSDAIRIQPSYALAHNNLAVALASQNRYDEAIIHYSDALRIQPDLADAHNGMGVVRANQSRYREAIDHFTEALRLQPGHANARENLEQAVQLQRSRGESSP